MCPSRSGRTTLPVATGGRRRRRAAPPGTTRPDGVGVLGLLGRRHQQSHRCAAGTLSPPAHPRPQGGAGVRRSADVRGHRFFAGSIAPGDWPGVGRVVFRLMGGRYGDARDWTDIDAWGTASRTPLDASAGAGLSGGATDAFLPLRQTGGRLASGVEANGGAQVELQLHDGAVVPHRRADVPGPALVGEERRPPEQPRSDPVRRYVMDDDGRELGAGHPAVSAPVATYLATPPPTCRPATPSAACVAASSRGNAATSGSMRSSGRCRSWADSSAPTAQDVADLGASRLQTGAVRPCRRVAPRRENEVGGSRPADRRGGRTR